MEEQSPILTLNHIVKSFSGVKVLKEISMEIFPGEVHCIVGENGAGKSTLIKIISGAYRLDNGSMVYCPRQHGEEMGKRWVITKGGIAAETQPTGESLSSPGRIIHTLTPSWARANGINAIYQEIDLIPSLSAAENIFLGNEPLDRWGGIHWKQIRRRAGELLDSIGADIELDAPVGKLKIAHQQMVAVAKALSLKSQVIIFDEPTAVFTQSEVETLFRVIERLQAQRIAIMYISHHLDEIFTIGSRVTVLRDGHHIRTDLISTMDKSSLVKAMVGREIDFSKRNGRATAGQTTLRVNRLSRKNSLYDVSLTLNAGNIVGIAGLVGAGRTELARTIIGAVPYDSGQIIINGTMQKIKSPRQALALGVGMLPENRKQEGLVLIRSISENAAYSLVESAARLGYVPWRRIKAATKRIIEQIKVRPMFPNLQVQYLSGGNQQKVALAKWLTAGSHILILDEPTRGVDVGARIEIYELMQKLKQEGKTILMISSDMTEILTQSDRILVMAAGRIVGELSGIEATEKQVISLALQLEEEII